MKVKILVKAILLLNVLSVYSCQKPQETNESEPATQVAVVRQVNTETNTLTVHPGALHTQSALSLTRANVASNTEPWISAWNAIKNTDAGVNYQPTGLSSTVTNAYLLQNHGHAAYVLAIKWVASNNISYANTAKNIINSWVNTVDSMATDPLRTGIGAIQMANAAEILATAFNGSAGWSATEVANAKDWFKAVVWPRIGTGGSRSSNWGTAALSGCMAVAIFCDDSTLFDYAVDAYKNGFSNAFRANGTPDGCAGVNQYIAETSGQSVEAGRDQGHPQGGVAHLVETAFMAYNQGINLVTFSNNRLVAGMEYLANYNLGNTVPYNANFADPCNVHPAWATISATGRGVFSPAYEMCNKLFSLTGITHPFTAQVVSSAGYTPEKTNSDHTGLGTLLYRY